MDGEQISDTPITLDMDELVERCLGNLEFAERVLARFQQGFVGDLAELEEAVAAQDAAKVARLAHRLKGAAANVAAHGIRDRARAIESLARQPALDEVPQHLSALRAQWVRFSETLPT